MILREMGHLRWTMGYFVARCMEDVEFMERLMHEGRLYELSSEMGSFIMAQRSQFSGLDIRPVQYAITERCKFEPGDFPLWAPAKEGRPSPWGSGHPTVNLHLLRSSLDLQ